MGADPPGRRHAPRHGLRRVVDRQGPLPRARAPRDRPRPGGRRAGGGAERGARRPRLPPDRPGQAADPRAAPGAAEHARARRRAAAGRGRPPGLARGEPAHAQVLRGRPDRRRAGDRRRRQRGAHALLQPEGVADPRAERRRRQRPPGRTRRGAAAANARRDPRRRAAPPPHDRPRARGGAGLPRRHDLAPARRRRADDRRDRDRLRPLDREAARAAARALRAPRDPGLAAGLDRPRDHQHPDEHHRLRGNGARGRRGRRGRGAGGHGGGVEPDRSAEHALA